MSACLTVCACTYTYTPKYKKIDIYIYKINKIHIKNNTLKHSWFVVFFKAVFSAAFLGQSGAALLVLLSQLSHRPEEKGTKLFGLGACSPMCGSGLSWGGGRFGGTPHPWVTQGPRCALCGSTYCGGSGSSAADSAGWPSRPAGPRAAPSGSVRFSCIRCLRTVGSCPCGRPWGHSGTAAVLPEQQGAVVSTVPHNHQFRPHISGQGHCREGEDWGRRGFWAIPNSPEWQGPWKFGT